MDFKIIKEIVTQIINAIQNTGVALGKSINQTLQTKTFPVEVKNPVKDVSVKGEVKVTNLVLLNETNLLLKKLKDVVISYKAPTTIEVKNFPKYPEFPKFPTKMEVTNIPNISFEKDLNVVVTALGEIKKKISDLKLDPKIQVDAPIVPAPIVNVPSQKPPVVNVEKPDMTPIKELVEFWQSLTESAKKSISVRLTDGTKFYKAVDKMVEIATSRNASPFVSSTGDEIRARVNDRGQLETTTTEIWGTNNYFSNAGTEYLGQEDVNGNWVIKKVVTDGNEKIHTYATNTNNASVIYEDAWENKTTLVYSQYYSAFNI
jgi:hypothetical protein